MSVTNFVLFKSSIAGTFMDMIKSLHPKFSRVVVSVCSGRSEMEMNSRDLCVCLDGGRQLQMKTQIPYNLRLSIEDIL